jgi:hypothetical protein
MLEYYTLVARLSQIALVAVIASNIQLGLLG